MGAKLPPQARRDMVLSVRMSEAEMAELQARAAAMAMQPSQYLRWVALSSGRPMSEFETQTLAEIRAFLARRLDVGA